MANRKISDLTALTAPVTGDLLPIVDISEAAAADKNKKITYGNLFTRIPAGIGFPATQVDSADPNTLDDYEEGTWTGTLREFPGTSTTTATGRYTKLGRFVHIQVAFLNVDLSAWGGNAAYMTGAPFTSGAETVGSLMTDFFTFAATGTSLNSWLEAASTQINFYASETNSTKKAIRVSPGTARNLWVTLVYTV